MRQYKELLQKILDEGTTRDDRTGTGTISLFGEQMQFDLQKGFPLVTVKKTMMRSILHELIWFLRGDTNIKYLTGNDVHIWDEWADENGELGPIYGKQWRSWQRYGYLAKNLTEGRICSPDNPIDQIIEVLTNLKENPYSRRHIVSAWNVAQLEQMALEPCHTMFQFYVRDATDSNTGEEFKYLDCKLYQRSADMFLGVPFNIASYAALVHLFAHILGYKAGKFIHSFGDAHIYLNHIDQVQLILGRECKPLPTFSVDFTNKNIKKDMFDDLLVDDFRVINYRCHSFVKGEISV